MSTKIVPVRSAQADAFADHGATIDRLRHLAMASYDTLLVADGPPQADYRLLEVCADALHAMKDAERLRREWHASPNPYPGKDSAAHQAWQKATRHGSSLVKAAGKLRAVTPAGLFAKALLVKHASSSAPALAASMAEDLLAIPSLRQSLWPNEGCGS